MSTRGLLFQWASTIKIQLSTLLYKVDIIIIISWIVVQSGHYHYHFMNCNFFSPWYSVKITLLVLNDNHPDWRLGINFDMWYIYVQRSQQNKMEIHLMFTCTCSSDKPPNSRWISNAYTTTMSYVLAQKIIKHKEIRKVIYLYCISVSDRSMEGSWNIPVY